MAWAPQPPSDDRAVAHRRMRYDDEDDFDVEHRRDRDRPRANPTSAGMIGFISAGVSIGLLIVVAVLWVFLKQENQANQVNAPEQMARMRWMLYWFLFLDVLSFCAALSATVFGARGISPSNPLYRGFAITALILGILEMVATLLFGLFMTCSVAVFELFRNMG